MIYFDNAATTRVSPAAIQAAAQAMLEGFGNPSSAHACGQEAARALARHRAAVAGALGAGDGRIGSFSHHTSFARGTAAEFLEEANARLAEAAAAWKRCGTVILTLGTAFVWRALERPGSPVVANCLKRPAREFAHELLSFEEQCRQKVQE